MFKNFNISKFKKMKPPADNSFTTMQEIKHIKSIPMDKANVRKYDDIEKTFAEVAYKNKIVVFNITELNKYKYNYGWEYRVMPKQTEFCLDNKIVKFVGYLDYNKLKDSDFVYEFNAENNLNTTKSLFAHK